MDLRGLRRRIWIRGPVFAYLILIFYFSSLSSIPWAPSYPDLLLHGVEYLGLAILLARALNDGLSRPMPARRMGLVFLLCILCGAVDEVYQWWTPNRLADYRDVLGDAAGAGLGLLALGLWHRLRARPPAGDAAEGAVLYTRPGCPLCFSLRRTAARAAREAGVPLRVVDVTRDAALQTRFGDDVPVLDLPGGRRIQGRFDPAEVEAAFRAVPRPGHLRGGAGT